MIRRSEHARNSLRRRSLYGNLKIFHNLVSQKLGTSILYQFPRLSLRIGVHIHHDILSDPYSFEFIHSKLVKSLFGRFPFWVKDRFAKCNGNGGFKHGIKIRVSGRLNVRVLWVYCYLIYHPFKEFVPLVFRMKPFDKRPSAKPCHLSFRVLTRGDNRKL